MGIEERLVRLEAETMRLRLSVRRWRWTSAVILVVLLAAGAAVAPARLTAREVQADVVRADRVIVGSGPSATVLEPDEVRSRRVSTDSVVVGVGSEQTRLLPGRVESRLVQGERALFGEGEVAVSLRDGDVEALSLRVGTGKRRVHLRDGAVEAEELRATRLDVGAAEEQVTITGGVLGAPRIQTARVVIGRENYVTEISPLSLKMRARLAQGTVTTEVQPASMILSDGKKQVSLRHNLVELGATGSASARPEVLARLGSYANGQGGFVHLQAPRGGQESTLSPNDWKMNLYGRPLMALGRDDRGGGMIVLHEDREYEVIVDGQRRRKRR